MNIDPEEHARFIARMASIEAALKKLPAEQQGSAAHDLGRLREDLEMHVTGFYCQRCSLLVEPDGTIRRATTPEHLAQDLKYAAEMMLDRFDERGLPDGWWERTYLRALLKLSFNGSDWGDLVDVLLQLMKEDLIAEAREEAQKAIKDQAG